MNFSGKQDPAFVAVNRQAMEAAADFCAWLLPGGRIEGQEYFCASLGGGHGNSCKVNLHTGKWADFNVSEHGSEEVRSGKDLIGLYAAVHGTTQGQALHAVRDWVRHKEQPTRSKSGPVDPVWYRSVKADHIWEYKDAQGNVICQMKRWNATDDRPKTVRPWNPQISDYKMPDVDGRPLLYLDEILNSAGPVVMVAGEKCADAVRALGYTATTNLGGESAVERTDYSVLAGRDVILWRDNDPAGERWVTKITEHLREYEASSVRLVDIPEHAPPKWDAADADERERRMLIEDAIQSRPIVRGIAFVRYDEITATEPPPYDWIVTGAVCAGKAQVLYGPGGCGKSLSLLDMAYKVATADRAGELGGRRCFLGEIPPSAAGATVYLTLEDDRDELNRRLHNIDKGNLHKGAPAYAICGLDIEGFDPTLIKQEDHAAVLTRLAEYGLPRTLDRIEKHAGRKVRLLILDPGGDFVGANENDSLIIKPFMFYLREFASKRNMAIMVCAHSGKGAHDAEAVKEGPRGSSAWAANSRCAFGLWRPPAAKSTRTLRSLGLDMTEKNIERLVCGVLAKANFPSHLKGIRHYLQDPNSGLLEEVTEAVQQRATDDDSIREQVLLGIRKAAAIGRPFTIRGNNGLGEMRERLPPGPCQDEKEVPALRLQKAAKELISAKKVCQRDFFSTKKALDVIGGPVAERKHGFVEKDYWVDPYTEEESYE